MPLFRPRRHVERRRVMVQSFLNIGARWGDKDQLRYPAALPPGEKAPINN